MNKNDEKIIERVLDDRYNLGCKVCCPVCGHNYLHVHVENLSCGGNWRGHVVVFAGECCHTWADVYGEHKGQVVKARVVLEGENYV